MKSLLTESVPTIDRVSVQGSADLMMSFCGGLAGFSSGFIRRALGFHVLSSFATLAAGLLLVTVWPSFQARRRQDVRRLRLRMTLNQQRGGESGGHEENPGGRDCDAAGV